jgi:hypothetical protein
VRRVGTLGMMLEQHWSPRPLKATGPGQQNQHNKEHPGPAACPPRRRKEIASRPRADGDVGSRCSHRPTARGDRWRPDHLYALPGLRPSGQAGPPGAGRRGGRDHDHGRHRAPAPLPKVRRTVPACGTTGAVAPYALRKFTTQVLPMPGGGWMIVPPGPQGRSTTVLPPPGDGSAATAPFCAAQPCCTGQPGYRPRAMTTQLPEAQ